MTIPSTFARPPNPLPRATVAERTRTVLPLARRAVRSSLILRSPILAAVVVFACAAEIPAAGLISIEAETVLKAAPRLGFELISSNFPAPCWVVPSEAGDTGPGDRMFLPITPGPDHFGCSPGCVRHAPKHDEVAFRGHGIPARDQRFSTRDEGVDGLHR